MNRTSLISLFVALGCVLVVYSQTKFEEEYLNNQACYAGNYQSPVALLQETSRFNSTYSLTERNYELLEDIRVTNEKPFIKVHPSDAKKTSFGSVVLVSNGYPKQYILEEINVIAPGLHNVDGKSADLEIIFKHRKNLDYVASEQERFERIPDSNFYLYVSVLYSQSASGRSDGGLIDTIISKSDPNNKNVLSIDLDKSSLFHQKPYYFYQGSTIEQPCNEYVNYIVYKEMYGITAEQLKTITDMYKVNYQEPLVTKRLFPTEERWVVRNFLNATETFVDDINFAEEDEDKRSTFDN